MGVGQKVPRPHEKQTIVMKYTTGLPTPKFADLLIRLRAAMGARGPWKSRMRPGDQVPQGDPFSASSTLLVHVRNISSDESNMCPTISGHLLDSAS